MKPIEIIAGCIDCFCYRGYDVVLQQQTGPVPENRRLHRKRWYLYQRGEFTGQCFKTDKEAMAFINGKQKYMQVN